MHEPSFETPDLGYCLFVAVHNASAIQVVGAELDSDAIAGEDADEVFAHTARNVREDLVLVLQLNLEQSVGQGLDNSGHYLNCIFLRQ